MAAVWRMLSLRPGGCNIGSSLYEDGQDAIATDLVMEARVAGARDY